MSCPPQKGNYGRARCARNCAKLVETSTQLNSSELNQIHMIDGWRYAGVASLLSLYELLPRRIVTVAISVSGERRAAERGISLPTREGTRKHKPTT